MIKNILPVPKEMYLKVKEIEDDGTEEVFLTLILAIAIVKYYGEWIPPYLIVGTEGEVVDAIDYYENCNNTQIIEVVDKNNINLGYITDKLQKITDK